MIHQSLKPSCTILAILFSGLIIISCSETDSSSTQDNFTETSSIPSVEAVKARYGSLPLFERLSGTVVSNNQVDLYPEITGRIVQVLAQDGQKVQQGEILAIIEDDQYREQLQQAEASLRIELARLKQAQARLNELEAQYRRTKQLAERQLSSELEIETLEAQMASAEADVELAEAQVDRSRSTVEEQRELLSKTEIRAPITGTVGRRNAEVGMQVSPSSRVFTIGDLGKLRVEVVLTGNMLNYVELGQTARIYAGGEDNNEHVITAEVSRISPFLNNVTRSTEAEIDVTNNDKGIALRPGMFVPVDILYGESQQATLIPTSAVYNDPTTGREGVYVVTSLNSEVKPAEKSEGDRLAPLTEPLEVQFKPIDIIARGQMEAGVKGIKPGTWIVTIGQDLLSGGRNQARVRVSTWERILALQGLQRQDLLQQILDVDAGEQAQSQQSTQ